MKAMQVIRIALKFSDGGMKLLDEMKADPLVWPGLWGGKPCDAFLFRSFAIAKR